MAKKYFCDKCDIEINILADDFDDLFDENLSLFEDKLSIIKPYLCNKCNKGYTKIIKKTNKEIKEFLMEK